MNGVLGSTASLHLPASPDAPTSTSGSIQRSGLRQTSNLHALDHSLIAEMLQ
jgi:hypothetical protein